MPKSITSPLIIALDYPNQQQAIDFAQTVDPELVRLKVGKQLFVNSGPVIVERLQRLGFEIFLDLKFHDIPNTVAKACVEAAKLGVWMTNVHAGGGMPMMEQVMSELAVLATRPLITAVTVLTSMDQATLTSLGIEVTIEAQVKRLAQLAKASGLDGVVCSAQEAKILRFELGKDFLLVTPGIRLVAGNDDQHRIMSPEEALEMGASHLVIGRPITKSTNPQQTIDEIIARIGVPQKERNKL